MAKALDIGEELDDESVAFLEEKLGAAINPHLETEEDYYRTVFYFKCCGVQEELKSSHKPAKGIETVEDCFFSKEKMDALFENLYPRALEAKIFMDKLNNATEIPTAEDIDKIMIYEKALFVGVNDFLCDKLHDTDTFGLESGNFQRVGTLNMQQLSAYFEAFSEPKLDDLVKNMGDNYHKLCDDAKGELSPLLPENADRTAYFAFVEEHPKAVRALAAVAEATGYSEQWCVSSPKELEMKCQHPAIVAYADKISFNEIGKSVGTVKEQIQVDLEQGKLRGVRDFASMAIDGSYGR